MKDQVIKKTTGMIAYSIDELNATYKKMGIIFRRQISKEVIFSSSIWNSIAFKIQNRNKNTGEFDSPRIMLVSFKNTDGMYKRFSYFNVRNKIEAEKICAILRECFELD